MSGLMDIFSNVATSVASAIPGTSAYNQAQQQPPASATAPNAGTTSAPVAGGALQAGGTPDQATSFSQQQLQSSTPGYNDPFANQQSVNTPAEPDPYAAAQTGVTTANATASGTFGEMEKTAADNGLWITSNGTVGGYDEYITKNAPVLSSGVIALGSISAQQLADNASAISGLVNGGQWEAQGAETEFNNLMAAGDYDGAASLLREIGYGGDDLFEPVTGRFAKDVPDVAISGWIKEAGVDAAKTKVAKIASDIGKLKTKWDKDRQAIIDAQKVLDELEAGKSWENVLGQFDVNEGKLQAMGGRIDDLYGFDPETGRIKLDEGLMQSYGEQKGEANTQYQLAVQQAYEDMMEEVRQQMRMGGAQAAGMAGTGASDMATSYLQGQAMRGMADTNRGLLSDRSRAIQSVMEQMANTEKELYMARGSERADALDREAQNNMARIDAMIDQAREQGRNDIVDRLMAQRQLWSDQAEEAAALRASANMAQAQQFQSGEAYDTFEREQRSQPAWWEQLLGAGAGMASDIGGHFIGGGINKYWDE